MGIIHSEFTELCIWITKFLYSREIIHQHGMRVDSGNYISRFFEHKSERIPLR